MSIARLIRGQLTSLSGIGFVIGTLFFAAALTPTLVPRSYLTQGVLAGACLAIGYALGALLGWLWRYLELREPRARMRRVALLLIAAFCLAVAVPFVWWSTEWQNSVRAVMGMEPVASANPLKMCVAALATFVVLLAVGRLFRGVALLAAMAIRRYVPRRVAGVVSVALAAFLFWSLASDLLLPAAFRAVDWSYREYDALLEPERAQPTDPLETGSAASLVKWDELGRAGREFIASGPTAKAISAFTGRPALEPVRVYVGLRGADTPLARARLALQELKRAGGFSRSTLVVITPTGTGWIDPAGMESVEYLHDGDIASVAVQYSYLSSPISLIVQPEYGAETARALFREVYNYWSSLPRDGRPKLYLFGLSLGALNSEQSAGPFEMIGDPINGAVWSGPPFKSRLWRSFTDGRNEGSPEWLPEFRDSRIVRFMNQNGAPVPATRPWGPMRIVYLQYASDPITFFDYSDLYRRPDWMKPPRGPDVSAELRWYPVVTMLQLALDMTVANGTPIGYGHVYAPEHYIDAWDAVSDVRNWSPEEIAALKRHLADEARAAMRDGGAEEQAYDGRGG